MITESHASVAEQLVDPLCGAKHWSASSSAVQIRPGDAGECSGHDVQLRGGQTAGSAYTISRMPAISSCSRRRRVAADHHDPGVSRLTASARRHRAPTGPRNRLTAVAQPVRHQGHGASCTVDTSLGRQPAVTDQRQPPERASTQQR